MAGDGIQDAAGGAITVGGQLTTAITDGSGLTMADGDGIAAGTGAGAGIAAGIEDGTMAGTEEAGTGAEGTACP